jgi:hypothetical protein
VVLGLCDRFRCRPSQALREDASVLRMLELEQLWKGGEQE